jgi:hypothetical protein
MFLKPKLELKTCKIGKATVFRRQSFAVCFFRKEKAVVYDRAGG